MRQPLLGLPLCQGHLTEQGLVDREAGDRIVVVEIGQLVDVALLPGPWTERSATPLVGVDRTADNIAGDPGCHLDPAAQGLHPDLVAVLDAAFGSVVGVDLDQRDRVLF